MLAAAYPVDITPFEAFSGTKHVANSDFTDDVTVVETLGTALFTSQFAGADGGNGLTQETECATYATYFAAHAGPGNTGYGEGSTIYMYNINSNSYTWTMSSYGYSTFTVFYTSDIGGGTTITVTDSGSTNTTSTFTSSLEIDPYYQYFATFDVGPLYFDNTTTVSTGHIVGNETTETTKTKTVISGGVTWDSVASQTTPTSVSGTQVYTTFTTISTPDTVTTTSMSFGPLHYYTTSKTVEHGTTFTQITYSCTPFLDPGKFKREYRTIYWPEINGSKEDWVWYFHDDVSNLSDYFGLTFRFDQLYFSTDGAFTIDDTLQWYVTVDFVRNTDASSEFYSQPTAIITHSTLTTTEYSTTSESYQSIRYRDTELPTPSYTTGITYNIIEPSTRAFNGPGETATSTVEIAGGYPDATITSRVPGPIETRAVTFMPFYTSSDGGRVTTTFSTPDWILTHSMQGTLGGLVIVTGDGYSSGQTRTVQADEDGFVLISHNASKSLFCPTYIEGFQLQPYLSHNTENPVYQWVGWDIESTITLTRSSVTTSMSFFTSATSPPFTTSVATTTTTDLLPEVCLGSTVRCPYIDEYILSSDYQLYWDEYGQPTALAAFETSADVTTLSAIAGGNVNTVMSTHDVTHDAGPGTTFSGRWRYGGVPRAGGKFSSYLRGAVEYTYMSDGSSSSSTQSGNGETFEMETSDIRGFMNIGMYEVTTQYFFNFPFAVRVLSQHTSSYFHTV